MALSVTQFLHSAVSRLEAEERLTAAQQDGSFLVRQSESIPGAFTLCMLHTGNVLQYRILTDNDGRLYIQPEEGVSPRKFSDLCRLINGYVAMGESNGLVCALRYPIVPQAGDAADAESDDDESSTDKDVSCDSGRYGAVVDQLMHRCCELAAYKQGDGMVRPLQEYLSRGLQSDLQRAASGDQSLSELNTVIAAAATPLLRELDAFLAKLDSCRLVFDNSSPINTNTGESPSVGDQEEGDRLSHLVTRLEQCQTSLEQLKRKVLVHASAANGSGGGEYTVPRLAQSPSYTPLQSFTKQLSNKSSSSLHFDARQWRYSRPGVRLLVTLDFHYGKIQIVKADKTVVDDSSVFLHNQVRQIVKSLNHLQVLSLLMDDGRKFSLLFDSAVRREHFAQAVQHLKHQHQPHDNIDHLSVFVGTWNMGNSPPPRDLARWLQSDGEGKTLDSRVALVSHDFYAIGIQESAISDKDLACRLKNILWDIHQQDFYTVLSENLWGMRLVVLGKPEYRDMISHVQTGTVRTGIANTLGNKGGVGASFEFQGTRLCFVTAHLTSGSERNTKRNQNYRAIMTSLQLGPKNLVELTDLTNRHHHLFFFGDLNYRLDGIDRDELLRAIDIGDYERLMPYDQLGKTQKAKEAFSGFCEESITFAPTYRFAKGPQAAYVIDKAKTTWVRVNLPSYCDRVLWRSYGGMHVSNTSYGFVPSVTTSDHRPVFASFTVSLVKQYVPLPRSTFTCTDTGVTLCMDEVSAKVKTTVKQYFIIELRGACLTGEVKSKPNDKLDRNFYCPTWSAPILPKPQCVTASAECLADEHIIVAVRSVDDMEVYGECVLPLKPHLSQTIVPFQCVLTHNCEETGYIKGGMCVKGLVDSDSADRNKNYVTVSFETDGGEVGGEEDDSVVTLRSSSGRQTSQHKLAAVMQAHEHFLYDTVQDDIFIGRGGKAATSHAAVMRSCTTDNFSQRGRTMAALPMGNGAVTGDIPPGRVTASDSGFQSQGAMARCAEEKTSDSSSSHLSASSSSLGSKMSDGSAHDDTLPPLPHKLLPHLS